MCASPSSSPRLRVYFLAGRDPLHETAVSALSCSPLARANAFSFLFRALTPVNLSSVPPPCVLALAFPLVLSFFTSVYPANFSMDSISSWLPPIPFHTFSTTLSDLIPGRPFVTFSHTALSAMAGNLFFGEFLTRYFILPFQLSHVFVSSGYIPSSALNPVFLVVLEYPSTF